MVAVVVTEGGEGAKMEAPTAAKMEAGVRGSGAEAAGSCSLASSPSAVWQGKRELQVPAGGARGWWRGPLCEAGRAGGRGEGPTLTGPYSFPAVTCLGI